MVSEARLAVVDLGVGISLVDVDDSVPTPNWTTSWPVPPSAISARTSDNLHVPAPAASPVCSTARATPSAVPDPPVTLTFAK
ncbi:MAG: hypothetical protein R2845_14280 [Thermomicrobiales bacterium]